MDDQSRPSFKNSVGGMYLRGLFYEETLADKSTVVYTLKDKDHEGYPSLYRLYMETRDPTEWRFATRHLDGWEHWERLCDSSWFKPYVERWRRELHLHIASESLARIMAEAKTSSRDSFTANRYLLERGWLPKEKGVAGRPSKEAVRKEASRIASESQQVTSDFERITRIN
jgi:nitrate reductase alpha subunit